MTGTISDTVRALAQGLAQAAGPHYLGSREDRDEMTFWVLPPAWRSSADFLRGQGFVELSDLTAVDYLDRQPRYDAMAILSSPSLKEYVRLKAVLAEDQPLDSLAPLWSGADWFEREVYDLFGIEFTDHPDLRRILLPQDYHGHPLRKDFPVTGPASSLFR
jgi:NADH-quinone oxidoreductase subunit C